MKIAFVLDDSLDKTDGVQQYILTLGTYYRTQGHEVHYIVGESTRTDIPNIHSLSKNIGIKFNQNRMSTPLPVKKKIISDLFDTYAFDVLHVQMPYSPFFAARVIKYAPHSTAIVGTFHIMPFSRSEIMSARALGLVLRNTNIRFDTIYSVSEPAQKFAQKSFNVSSKIMPNTIDIEAFKNAKIPSESSKEITIVFLGRLVERKGCLYLLKAIDALHKKRPLHGVHVLICGKGPLLTKLETFVKKAKLDSIVSFKGYVDESKKAGYLAHADIAVFPSTGGESFGIVLLEAMAAGSKVVIAGNNAGYKSVLGTANQQIINPRDTDAFANILDHFISNSQARQEAYAWQQEHVLQYDVNQVGSTMLKDYERVIAERRKTMHNKD